LRTHLEESSPRRFMARGSYLPGEDAVNPTGK
jgi:hypothetical protein